MQYRPRVMGALHRKHGDVFSVRMPYGPSGSMVTVVILADPVHIREVFAGPTGVFHAGEGNVSLLDVMGAHSLLLLDDEDHVRAKRLLMPAFTGRAIEGYRGLVADLARAEVGRWPDEGRVVAVDRMQAITLEIILRVIFGITDGRRLEEMRPLVKAIANVGLLQMFAWRYRRLQKLPPWAGFLAKQRRLDELIYAEIADRREDPGLAGREDLLSRLLRSREGDDALTDAELRDQLVTFLLAGHETTATTLGWTLHEIAHRPEVQEAAVRAARSGPDGDAYLEAVVKEAMRLRPVIFQATRTLTEPVTIAGYDLPAGVVVSPALGLMGVHPGHHDDPLDFRPERFLDTSPPPNTWIPFGGGARRCIGATFSLMESVEILREVLTRYDVAPADGAPDRLQPRGIINAPHRGARIDLRRRHPADRAGIKKRRSVPRA